MFWNIRLWRDKLHSTQFLHAHKVRRINVKFNVWLNLIDINSDRVYFSKWNLLLSLFIKVIFLNILLRFLNFLNGIIKFFLMNEFRLLLLLFFLLYWAMKKQILFIIKIFIMLNLFYPFLFLFLRIKLLNFNLLRWDHRIMNYWSL